MCGQLPQTLQQFQQQFPRAWKSYAELRNVCDRAGSLDAKTAELIKIAVEVAQRRHGGLIAHIHRAQKAGATAEDIFQVLLLTLPLVGLPDVLDAFKVASGALERSPAATVARSAARHPRSDRTSAAE